jgi:hypothetical protein
MPIFHDTPLNPQLLNLTSAKYTQKINESYFIFELFQKIKVNSNVDIFITLESFKFTNSVYNINQYTNKFYYALAPDYNVTYFEIEQQNYYIDNLISYLNTNLNSVGFTFTYDTAKLKITITHNSNEFRIYPNEWNCLKILGFQQQIYYSSSQSLTSVQSINLLGAQIININILNISLNTFGIVSSDNTNSNNKTLESIPITCVQGDTQNYTSSYRHKVNETVISFLEIELRDENNNLILFNGIDWYMTISFIYSYKKLHILPSNLYDIYNNQNLEQSQQSSQDNNNDDEKPKNNI